MSAKYSCRSSDLEEGGGGGCVGGMSSETELLWDVKTQIGSPGLISRTRDMLLFQSNTFADSKLI